MGAWGYGPMENDAAWDWIAKYAAFPLVTAIEDTLRAALSAPADDLKNHQAEAAAALLLECTSSKEDASFLYAHVRPHAIRKRLWDLAIESLQKVMANRDWLAGWTDPHAKIRALERLVSDLQQSKNTNVKAAIGDIIEVSTLKGYAYLQYTHSHEDYGYLVRVLPGFHQSPRRGFAELVNQVESFYTFIDLEEAIDGGHLSIVGHELVPDRCRQFPLFKAGIKNPATGRVETWWLWDGKREWKVAQLTPEQRNLPVRGVCSLPWLLVWPLRNVCHSALGYG